MNLQEEQKNHYVYKWRFARLLPSVKFKKRAKHWEDRGGVLYVRFSHFWIAQMVRCFYKKRYEKTRVGGVLFSVVM